MKKIPGYYELWGKLNHWKEKYKEDTSKLESQIKEQIKEIEKLKERIKEIESEDHYYQLWLKEREERIKDVRENTTLLDEIITLKEKLTIAINNPIIIKGGNE